MSHLLDKPTYSSPETAFDLLIDGIIHSSGLANFPHDIFGDLLLGNFVYIPNSSFEDGVYWTMVRCAEFGTVVSFQAELQVFSTSSSRSGK